jgi:hypothetical protein
MSMLSFRLGRNPFQQLVFTSEEGEEYEGVVPVRAFPIAAPAEGISLVSAEGRELAWIEHLDRLPDVTRSLVEEELGKREFVPEIRRLLHVSSFSTPSIWQVETDRGDTQLVLKGEEDIRRLGASSLLIADSHGIQFLIRDLGALDKASRRLLDRFL